MLNKQFHKRLFNNATLGLFIIIFVLPQTSVALNSDRNKAMQINAGKLVINEKQGTSLYSGTVKIIQGSRTITGESITIYTKTDDITKIVIKGKPASFSQLNDKNEAIKASGNEMIFYSDKDLLILTQNAVLQQKDNVFRSEKITYNTAKDIITAGTDTTENDRVKITIHPKEDSQTPE
ncbi:MAG: lipopolysaccharide transport periplasmic protein LptA [Gammaproteobacteria bacterium]|nr:lipopolysaccharide transport periplasmic protein LptA [Gammaproteobacteria bacterium]